MSTYLLNFCNLIGHINCSHADGVLPIPPVLEELFEEGRLPHLRQDLDLGGDTGVRSGVWDNEWT